MKPIALVTGGNRGIGRGIVLALAQRGFDVAFADLAEVEDTQITRDEAAKRGARVAFAVGDIADLAQHERLVDAAYALGGRLDVLVNNAGVSVANRGDVLDVSPESFDRVLGINLRGTFFLSQRAARRMLADPPPEHHRAIVTISSANAVMVSPDRAEYCFSKAALSMMVRILAMRLGEAGIAAYEVRPGIVRTQMTRVASEKYDRLIAAGLTPLSRWGEAQDVGRVVGALAAGELPFVTGEAVHVDGGLHIHRL
ncbi:MAG: 3-ketoacyl-ACP reductase [Burkholderiales bacterium]|nr:3-ketoacyl-ACP reductase [Burkholderiales bacterium]